MKKSTLSLYVYGAFCLVVAVIVPVLFAERIDSLDREGIQLVLVLTYSSAVVLTVCLGASLIAKRVISSRLRLAKRMIEKEISNSSYFSRREEVLKQVFALHCTAQGRVPDMRYYNIWRGDLVKANSGYVALRNKLEEGQQITLPSMPPVASDEHLSRTLPGSIEEAFGRMRISSRV
jgi:hypothetical protein